MNIIYLIGSVSTLICITLCLLLFIFTKSKAKDGNRVEIKNNSSEGQWSLSSWIAGVFVAGTGVALMYAPSDLISYTKQGLNPIESIIMVALLNGAPVWALYSIFGIWYMNHMESKVGKLAAMLSTILGMAISLWTGMNTVARFIGLDVPGFKFLLASVTVLMAMISAKYGLLKKMSKLAFIAFLIAFLALISTPLTEITITPITGSLTSNFWKEYFLGETSASWIFWFLSWTPTVARWLAQISKGRTMREYIAGTMILPTVLAVIWMVVSWLYQDLIISFSIINNFRGVIPAAIFIISGILFMTGTLDSDCKVFTEDLESISNQKIKKESSIIFYGLFVLLIYSFFLSGILKNPFAFNEYSSMIFIPLLVFSICFVVKEYFGIHRKNTKS